MAMPPSSVAFRDESPPPSFPTGVRAALRITVFGMAGRVLCPFVQVRATTDAPRDARADTIAIGVFEGEDVAHDLEGGPLQALLDSGEAKRGFKKLAVTHADGRRWLLVGLGERDRFDAERARIAAALTHRRAGELSARTLCWELPHKV